MSGGQVRLQADSFLTVRQGFLGLAATDEQLTEVALGYGQAGVKGNGGTQGFDCLIDLAAIARILPDGGYGPRYPAERMPVWE